MEDKIVKYIDKIERITRYSSLIIIYLVCLLSSILRWDENISLAIVLTIFSYEVINIIILAKIYSKVRDVFFEDTIEKFKEAEKIIERSKKNE